METENLKLVDPLLRDSGITQTIFHIGRFAEWRKCGELALYYLDEVLADRELIDIIESSVSDVQEWKTKHFETVFQFRLYRILLYVAVRVTRPSVIVETGVLHGLTSIFLLHALERNGHGKLISVDLPSYAECGPSNNDGYDATLPVGREPGWIVPQDIFPNWDLKIGASQAVLPTLENERVGLFCHDSEHTFPTMWYELNWGWKNLIDGGLLVCDNIEANTSFPDFCRQVGREGLYFPAPDTNLASPSRFAMTIK